MEAGSTANRTTSYRSLLLLSISTWILAVSSVHTSMLLFGRDVLALPFLAGPYVSFDAWSLVHVLFFHTVAYSFPNRFWYAMALGVAWELAEAWFAGLEAGLGRVWEERRLNSLWDVYFNAAGYRLGEWRLARHLARPGGVRSASPYPIVFAFAGFCMAVGAWGVANGRDPAAFVTAAVGCAVCAAGWFAEGEGAGSPATLASAAGR